MAWSVPVVAVAAAAPAFASSCQVNLVIDANGTCKDAPNEKVRVNFTLTTSGSCPLPPGCLDNATIDKIVEGVGGNNAEVLFDAGASVGTPIVICGLNQQSGQIVVTATIPCLNGGEPDTYNFTLNQQDSSIDDCAVDDPLDCTTVINP